MNERYKYGENWKIIKDKDDKGEYVRFKSENKVVKIYKCGKIKIEGDLKLDDNIKSEITSTNNFTTYELIDFSKIYKPYTIYNSGDD